MATIKLSLSKKVDFFKRAEIRIRFMHGKIDQQTTTAFAVPPEYWCKDTQKIIIPKLRVMNDEKKELLQYLTEQNEKLNALTSHILTVFNAMDKTDIAPDWLVLTIDKYNFPAKYAPKKEKPKEVKKITLFEFIEQFIADTPNRKNKATGRPLTRNNEQHYRACNKHLENFAKTLRKKDFEFEEINQSFYDKYIAYLQSLGFTQNTVGKQIRVLKLMLNHATLQGVNTNVYYNSFHVFQEEIDSIYLNEAELQQLKEVDLSGSPYLDRVRDWFLLLAWTGSRFSDLGKITSSDIKDGFITFRQQKTNSKVVIPLHPVVLEILEKYNYTLPEEISNQKFNDYIKEVALRAGIKGRETTTRTVGGRLVTKSFEKWEQVSSHTGRRSFCTNMYKRGLPMLMIMSISGHKTEKSFLKYIKVKQSEHAEMMAAAWKAMF